MPRLVSLVILRGSGRRTTAALARLAAEHGVRTLAHAEGEAILYIHAAADPARRSPSPKRASTASASATATSASWTAPPPISPHLSSSCSAHGLDVRGDVEGAGVARYLPVGHEWASDE